MNKEKELFYEIDVIHLSGTALDYAVAKAQGFELLQDAVLNGELKKGWYIRGLNHSPNSWVSLEDYRPSQDWILGGPMLAAFNISLDNRKGEPCRAFMGTPAHHEFVIFAPEGELLTAAMRCHVFSRLGESVSIPAELVKPTKENALSRSKNENKNTKFGP